MCVRRPGVTEIDYRCLTWPHGGSTLGAGRAAVVAVVASGAHHHHLNEAPWTPALLPVAGQWRARRLNNTHLLRRRARAHQAELARVLAQGETLRTEADRAEAERELGARRGLALTHISVVALTGSPPTWRWCLLPAAARLRIAVADRPARAAAGRATAGGYPARGHAASAGDRHAADARGVGG
jgi:hypothetical protein